MLCYKVMGGIPGEEARDELRESKLKPLATGVPALLRLVLRGLLRDALVVRLVLWDLLRDALGVRERLACGSTCIGSGAISASLESDMRLESRLRFLKLSSTESIPRSAPATCFRLRGFFRFRFCNGRSEECKNRRG